jgi:probable F420-dependent oxidoreductase
MKFGLSIFPSVETTIPGERAMEPVELGTALEERGFESIFLAEHSHMPENGGPYPGPEGKPPNYFYSMLDPFVVLSAIAAVTRRLTVASGVTLISQRDPITLAKEVATLDVLTGGRYVMGIGAGWNLEEIRNHGVNPKRRFAVMRERLDAMKAIWREDVVEYHGEFVDFSPMRALPKPLQRPHPPIFLGGWAPAALQRVLDIADGWLAPNVRPLPEVADSYRKLCAMAEEQDKKKPQLVLMLRSADAAEIAIAEELEPDRCLFYTDPLNRDQMLRQLDEWAAAVELTR